MFSNTNRMNNDDLIWQIGNRLYFEKTEGFLKRFESGLCLFSHSVKQLYSNYQILWINGKPGRMVTFPNLTSHHETFNNVLKEAVIPTGIRILPSEIGGQSNQIYVAYKSLTQGKTQIMPLKQALDTLSNRYGKDDFLPVIVDKGFQFINGAPAMHLHRVDMTKLGHLSAFEKEDLRRTISEKLSTLSA